MGTLRSRLTFDVVAGEIRDQDRRYLLMRPDVLMGMLHELDELTRLRVLRMMAASAARHGGRSVQAYISHMPAAELSGFMQEASADLGWGAWRIEHQASSVELTVVNSPFAQGYGAALHPVCAPIAGVFQAMASAVLGAPAAVEEVECAAMGRHAACRFIATPAPVTTQDHLR
ncbi:MAG: 4-vinyl reductase [Pigmentiphaga sp.]|uniref:4-vinyl reductase 4VR domain-containing protein n=1 Tax=Pigmentiphaga daeguensis TaxID=414049 RepID=A0ABP3N1S2_9BURK